MEKQIYKVLVTAHCRRHDHKAGEPELGHCVSDGQVQPLHDSRISLQGL